MSRRVRAQGIGLGLAAGLGQRGREIREQHRQKEPNVEDDEVHRRDDSICHQLLNEKRERQERPDFDHEHHRVLPLDVRPQHHERLL